MTKTDLPPIPNAPALPTDSAKRKEYPIYSGFIAYFPHAIAECAHRSWKGNQQHHPESPLHWDMGKSQDEKDCEMRHMIDALLADDDTTRKDELTAKAWRAMADLERFLTGRCIYHYAESGRQSSEHPD